MIVYKFLFTSPWYTSQSTILRKFLTIFQQLFSQILIIPENGYQEILETNALENWIWRISREFRRKDRIESTRRYSHNWEMKLFSRISWDHFWRISGDQYSKILNLISILSNSKEILMNNSWECLMPNSGKFLVTDFKEKFPQ